jgi:hypothetical protein
VNLEPNLLVTNYNISSLVPLSWLKNWLQGKASS